MSDVKDIPAGVMEKALTYVGQPVSGEDLSPRDVIAVYVARAIMEERERCIATVNRYFDHEYGHEATGAPQAIAEAIRAQP